jgi:hypothetical protein
MYTRFSASSACEMEPDDFKDISILANKDYSVSYKQSSGTKLSPIP